MNEEEKRALMRAIEEDQQDAAIRDKIREYEAAMMDHAMSMRARYNAYIKVGFPEGQAFALCVNYMAMLFQAAQNRPDNRR